jgi:hypothetical protein
MAAINADLKVIFIQARFILISEQAKRRTENRGIRRGKTRVLAEICCNIVVKCMVTPNIAFYHAL